LNISLEAIGHIVNDVREPVDSGWGRVESRIVLRDGLAPALQGLADFSHVVVVFWMHRVGMPDVLQRRPQGRADMPELGLLAQRSKHRPNPIGVTTVRLVGVADGEIVVRGLDAVNGTPVLDVKPWFPVFDLPDGARVPDWVERLMADYF
jgi:tRNA-Thr(GGU) m(6)t(6)A37 methyltransferase TsaA